MQVKRRSFGWALMRITDVLVRRRNPPDTDARRADAVNTPCKDGGWGDTVTRQESPRTAGCPQKQRRAHEGFYPVSEGPPSYPHLDLRLRFPEPWDSECPFKLRSLGHFVVAVPGS